MCKFKKLEIQQRIIKHCCTRCNQNCIYKYIWVDQVTNNEQLNFCYNLLLRLLLLFDALLIMETAAVKIMKKVLVP